MSITENKRFGGLLRVFAKMPDQVERNVKQATEAALAMSNIVVEGKPLFAEILVLVAADKRHLDHDHGETLEALRGKLKGSAQISVQAVEDGDVFCVALNYGVGTLLRKRVDYACILSHGALGYLSDETVQKALYALQRGARVVGVAFEELWRSVLEGRIANTFAFWDLISLVSVGGFDLRAAQPRANDPTFPYLRGWAKEKGEVFYPCAGVEEIIPLIRMVSTYGPCIAPIPATGSDWKVPDPTTDPEGFERHIKKMGTKFERQSALAFSIGADLSVLKGGVMPAYRTF